MHLKEKQPRDEKEAIHRRTTVNFLTQFGRGSVSCVDCFIPLRLISLRPIQGIILRGDLILAEQPSGNTGEGLLLQSGSDSEFLCSLGWEFDFA